EATRAVLTHDYVVGLEFEGKFKEETCVPCLVGKGVQRPFDHKRIRATRVGQLLHMDICGQYGVKTPQGYLYFMIILDDKTNFGFVGLLRTRDTAIIFYKVVEPYLKRVGGGPVETVRFDGARELCEGQMKKYIQSQGTVMQVTAAYAHQQNGKAERYVRVIEEGGAALLADAGLSETYWGDAVLCYIYVRNRVPTSTLPANVTPYEALLGSKPDVSHFRVFGCLCYPIIPPEERVHGGPRRFPAVFLGYRENRVGWHCRDIKGRYYFSRDVIFDELRPGRLGIPRSVPVHIDTLVFNGGGRALRSAARGATVPERQALPVGTTMLADAPLSDDEADMDRARALHAQALDLVRVRRSLAPISADAVVSESLLATFMAYKYVQDSEPHLVSSLADVEEEVMRGACLAAYVSDKKHWSPKPVSFDLSKPPASYEEMLLRPDCPKWMAACQREADSLHLMGALEPDYLPPGRKSIKVKWVFAHKHDPEGMVLEVEGEKARLVVKGFSQRPEDYGEVSSPVARTASIRAVMAYAATKDLELMALDVKTAFLHAKLDRDIYIDQIPGFPLKDPKMVYKLKVALYGLKQAAYEFYQLVRRLMGDVGMLRCEVDHAVFVGEWLSSPDPSVPMPSDGGPLRLIFPIHVDDGIGAASNRPLWTWFIGRLRSSLNIKDLGPVELFLGMQVLRDRANRRLWLSQRAFTDLGPVELFLGMQVLRDRANRRLWLSQRAFTVELLQDWNMKDCRPAPTPLEPGLDLFSLPPAPANALPDIKDKDVTVRYQSLVGSILYLACTTRPDLAYAAMALGQFNSRPTRAHLLAAKRVLRYLAGTVELSLELG
ncbi:hypothetical protein CVT24_013130, partial [Panaeolus cyanescens]